MHHVIAILSNHAHWQAYPITGHHADGDTYLFLDHHMPIADRARVIIDLAEREDAEIVRVVLEPPAGDCAAGLHDWRIVTQDAAAIGAQCRSCSAVETFSFGLPYVEAGPLAVNTRMTAS